MVGSGGWLGVEIKTNSAVVTTSQTDPERNISRTLNIPITRMLQEIDFLYSIYSSVEVKEIYQNSQSWS